MKTLVRSSLSVALAMALLAQGCSPEIHRRLVEPAELTQRIERAGPASGSAHLNAHMLDGSFVALAEWRFDPAERSISGEGHRLDANRWVVSSGPLEISVDSVAVFETNRPGPPVSVAGVIVMAAAACGMIVLLGIQNIQNMWRSQR